MSKEAVLESMWSRTLIRPAQVIVALLLTGCLISIVGLGLLAAQGRSRLHTIRERADHADRMPRLGLRAQQSLFEHPDQREVVDRTVVEELRQKLRELRATGPEMDPANNDRLEHLASILVFNFYPVTAAMIVLLALLNDGPILAIAFHRTTASERPERWNMGRVLGISTLLGFAGVIATFGLFFFAENTFHLGRETIQSLIFLNLAVAGHLTIFLTRTRGPFWSSRPSATLLWAAIVKKMLATLAAVYGVFMAPIGWRWALFVWGYSLAWFLVNDLIKRAGYRLFDSAQPGLLAFRPSITSYGRTS